LKARNVLDPQHQVHCFLTVFSLHRAVGGGRHGKIIGSPSVCGKAAVLVSPVHFGLDSVFQRNKIGGAQHAVFA